MARVFTDKTMYEGETLSGVWPVPADTESVVVKISDGTKSATVDAVKADDSTFKATTAPDTLSGFSGATRWIVYATTPGGTEVVASGSIYIRPLVSRYRAVVAAIETALQNWANNPNQTITVDSINITYKDRDDLLGILNYWRSRADADENGVPPSSCGIRRIKVRF